jgi:hypothetical protein
MAAGANNNQLKTAEEKTAVMEVMATAIAAGTTNNQLKVVVEKLVVVAVVAMAAATAMATVTAANTNDGEDDGNDDGGSRSGSSGGRGDEGGDGCGGALGNLPSVNNRTILLMMFPTISMTLMPPQWQLWDERHQHVRRGRGWAMMQCYVASLSSALATDQSKLPKDNGG